MGNCHNSDDGKHGNIYIQTDKSYYLAGDVI